MEITIKIDKKLMSKDKEGNSPVIINHIVSYPDIHGRIRHNAEDEIRLISKNLIEVISEADKWHKLNPVKEESK